MPKFKPKDETEKILYETNKELYGVQIAAKKMFLIRRMNGVISKKKPWKNQQEHDRWVKKLNKVQEESLAYFQEHYSREKVEFT